MPLAKLKPDLLHDHALPRGPRYTPTLDGVTAVASPARALQSRLEAVGAPGTDFDRWKPRSSLALILSASVALWAAILVMAAQTVHAIA